MSESPLRVALTTLPRRDDAESLAAGAVEAGLAACAQVEGPVTSHYRWEGKACREEEWRLVLKTDPRRLQDLAAWIAARHPYRTPQWVVLAADGSAGYVDWVRGDA